MYEWTLVSSINNDLKQSHSLWYFAEFRNVNFGFKRIRDYAWMNGTLQHSTWLSQLLETMKAIGKQISSQTERGTKVEWTEVPQPQVEICTPKFLMIGHNASPPEAVSMGLETNFVAGKARSPNHHCGGGTEDSEKGLQIKDRLCKLWRAKRKLVTAGLWAHSTLFKHPKFTIFVSAKEARPIKEQQLNTFVSWIGVLSRSSLIFFIEMDLQNFRSHSQ